jgi:hypothetical protein
MDKDIVKMLEFQLKNYEEKFSEFEQKDNWEAVLKYAKLNYIEPINRFVLPFIFFRMQESRDAMKDYLPYIKGAYRDYFLRDEIFKNEKPITKYSDVAKEIVKEYNLTAPKLINASEEDKSTYVNTFCSLYEIAIEKIAQEEPLLALSIISKIRNPAIQFNLVRNPSIILPIKKLILTKLINQDWNGWVETYFNYPRTSSMEAYMNLWQVRPQIHIKHGKVFFAQYYETVKIWLKSKEKLIEKQF